jgi:hypothetical protein
VKPQTGNIKISTAQLLKHKKKKQNATGMEQAKFGFKP